MGDAASGARFTPGFAESTEGERESVFWSMADRPADGTPPPPGWFLRKNVILGELERCEMQERGCGMGCEAHERAYHTLHELSIVMFELFEERLCRSNRLRDTD